MEQLSYILGRCCKIILDVELAAIMMRTISDIFLKKDNPIHQILFFMTEPLFYTVRQTLSGLKLFLRAPLDMACCLSFFLLASIDLTFSIWF